MEEALPFVASSFDPPAAATTRYPPWVLLNRKGFLTDCDNDTTAKAVTSTGRTIKVTFCLADPPIVSYFCVHSPELGCYDFSFGSTVVSSDKDFVVLRLAFIPGRGQSIVGDFDLAQYFVYKAGLGKPSLKAIPTNPGNRNPLQACILACDDDDGEFLLADLDKTLVDYVLNIFSSKTDKWISMSLQLQTSPGVSIEDLPSAIPDKVIALGGGAIGWVDLWRGIVFCNVLDKNPVLRFIPIPKFDLDDRRDCDPRPVRDVTCCNGFIKFVELDLRTKEVLIHNKTSCKMMKDLDSVDAIYDWEMLVHKDDVCFKPMETIRVPDGWVLRTCYRHTSWDYWCKGHTVDIDDISPDNPMHFKLLPELWDAITGRWTLRNLTSAYPTLGIPGDNLVYLMSNVIGQNQKAWMIGLDLGKKTVEVLGTVGANHFCPDFLPCAFSEYLNATPRSCAEEIISTPNGAQIVTQNNLPPQQYMWRHYGSHGSSVESADGAQPCYDNYEQSKQYPILASSGSGTQQMTYQVLNTDPYGQILALTAAQ